MLPLRDNVPTRGFPAITLGIIVANAVVWLWEITGTSVDDDVLHYGYYPCSVQGPCVSPAPSDHLPAAEGVFTSMFMHGSWLHIGGNMLFLWIFGNNVEDSLGRFRYLLWYLAAGVAATAAQTAVTLTFGTAQDASVPNVGASGAIAGVLGAYLVILPRASVLTLFFLGFIIFLREIPALFYLGVWALLQALEGGISLLEPQSGGGIAFFAHLGGFLFGILTIRTVMRRQPLRPSY